jgi:hypothetical protein
LKRQNFWSEIDCGGRGLERRSELHLKNIAHFFASTHLMADPSPLSSATRATKRNLLAESLVPIAANTSNLRVYQISVVGLSIDFEDRLFSFLMLAVPFSFWVLSFFSNSRITSRGKIDLFEQLRVSSNPRTYAREAERRFGQHQLRTVDRAGCACRSLRQGGQLCCC